MVTKRLKPLEILKQTVLEWQQDNVPTQAAALAYYTVFAIAPLLLVVLAVAGLFTSADAARERLLLEIGTLIGAGGAEWIGELLEKASANQGGSIISVILGLGGLVLGASGAFGQLQLALNTIWEAKPPAKLSAFVRARATSFGLVLVMGFLLLVSLTVSAGISALGARVGLADAVWLWRALYELGSLLTVGALFALIYRFLPDTPVQWHDALVGGVFTSVLFALGKTLIGLYLGVSASQSVFGAAGTLAVLLIWIYYAAQIILFGAEFTQVYAKARLGAASLSPDARSLEPVITRNAAPIARDITARDTVARAAITRDTSARDAAIPAAARVTVGSRGETLLTGLAGMLTIGALIVAWRSKRTVGTGIFKALVRRVLS